VVSRSGSILGISGILQDTWGMDKYATSPSYTRVLRNLVYARAGTPQTFTFKARAITKKDVIPPGGM